jgi:RNA polymerase sigma-70 factor (ECF subfamily)
MRERARLLAYAMVILRDEHAAEDIFQDITVAAIAKADEIQSEAHLMGWLRRACRFRALELSRNRRNHACLLDADVLDALEPHWVEQESTGPADEVLAALRACVKKLSPGAQQLVKHRYVDGLTGQRLAEKLGRKLNTTYIAVSRVHKALHRCIQERSRAVSHRLPGGGPSDA